MAKLLKVCLYPDAVLRKKALLVKDFGAKLKELAEDMAETMYMHKGIGLAANQVGELRRLFILDTDWKEKLENTQKIEKAWQAYINPEIVSRDGETEYEEGCLSIPQVYAVLHRAEFVRVQYQDLSGAMKQEEFSGLRAIAFQHELDHLNGVLFFDHISAFKRRTLLEKFTKLQLEKDRDDD